MRDIIDDVIEDAIRRFLADKRTPKGDAFRIRDAVALEIQRLAPHELCTLLGELIRRGASVSYYFQASELDTERKVSAPMRYQLFDVVREVAVDAMTRILSCDSDLAAEEERRLRNSRRRTAYARKKGAATSAP